MIHGRESCGELGIPNLKDVLIKRNYNRFDRINKIEDDPYKQDKQIEAARKIIKEPTEEMTDLIEKLENKTDCRALKNHWTGELYYKSTWVAKPPKWMKSNHYIQIIRTRLGVLQTPSREGREKKNYSLRACPLCNIPCANLNHIISTCPNRNLKRLRQNRRLATKQKFKRLVTAGINFPASFEDIRFKFSWTHSCW